MGLDHGLVRISREVAGGAGGVRKEREEMVLQCRKNYPLHAWGEAVWERRTQLPIDDMNRRLVALAAEDLDELERLAREGMPERRATAAEAFMDAAGAAIVQAIEGEEPDAEIVAGEPDRKDDGPLAKRILEEDLAEILRFVKEGRRRLAEGDGIAYWAWW